MTDWKSTCLNFNQYQDSDKLFDGSCSYTTAGKTIKDFVDMGNQATTLKARVNATDYVLTQDDQQILRNKMNEFCCAMWMRNDIQNHYNDAKQDLEVAKKRVEVTRNPPADVSYLGTYVPFGRPLRSDSVPVLIGVTLTFLILSLGLLLNLGNVQLAYVAPRSYGPSFFQNLVESFRETSWPLLGITVAASAAVAGSIYYGIQKTHPEWLGLKPV